jgi:hypothetical protein
MYHMVEFITQVDADIEISSKQPLERISLREGMRVRAQVKPYVVETKEGLVEVGDLFFEDGTVTRRVPFACFRFLD